MTSANRTEVVLGHTVKLDTELLCCPHCQRHLRLALVLDQSTDYPRTPKTVILWAVPVPDTAQTNTEKENQPDILKLERIERRAIFEALDKACGDKLLAARMLGIGKTTLYRKLKAYGASDYLSGPEDKFDPTGVSRQLSGNGDFA